MTDMIPKRILVIEDNVTYSNLIKLRLESIGYKVLRAHDGLGGLELARKEKPDLIILDIMIPKMDGHQVCRLLKSDQEVAHIPIIMLTSKNTAEDVELASQYQVDGYFLKTTRTEIMLDLIKSLLEKNSAS